MTDNNIMNSNKKEIFKKLASHYEEWRLLLSALEKEEEILHKEFIEVIDLEKMKNLVGKIKD